MRNIITGGALIALVFTVGYFAGVTHEQLKVARNKNSVAQQGLNRMAENATILTTSLNAQRDRETSYAKNIQSDTARTEALLNRVMRHFDSVRDAATHTGNHGEVPATADTCTSERAEARRLSGQLRDALGQYGSEARRADENTRLLNECIIQLEEDRVVWNKYQF